jgi:hypothetical protein
MHSLYLDASALVKFYITERGSAWMAQQLGQNDPDHGQQRYVTTHLSNIEVVCALERAHRSGRINSSELGSARRRFLLDMRGRYRVLTADLDMILAAVRRAQGHQLRSYDAVHLAAALEITRQATAVGLPAPVFVSADEVLLAAAQAEGLQTENPNDHP